MLIRLRGLDVPTPLLAALAAATDHAMVRPAEEDRGHTCFGLDVTFASLDIELATEPDIPGQP